MANSGFANPLIIRDDAAPIELERIPLTGAGTVSAYNEEYVQKLAFEHPDCLPIAEIDRAYLGLVPVCMELNTPAGPIDALYVTPAGRLVILEAKLWRNPEARRKVVAQILDYAKEFSRWDYEDLQRETSRRLGKKGNALFELVKARYPETDEARFVDEIQQSLRRGRFLLIILGDGIRRGAAAIAEFLQSFGNLEFTFGLVEIALYKHPEIGTLVQPRVVARTVEIGRSVFELPDGVTLKEPEEEAEEAAEEAKNLEATRAFYRSFWTEFIGELQLDDAAQQMPNITKSTNIFLPMPPHPGAAWVSAYFSKSSNKVGVYFRFRKGNFGELASEKLNEDREEIEADLGIPVKWRLEDGQLVVGVKRRFADVHDPKYRSAIKMFFADNLNRFVNTFRPRLERLGEE